MKNYYLLYLLLFLYTSCINDPDLPLGNKNGKKADVVTLDPENVSFTKVTLSGLIETENGYEILSKGFFIDTIEQTIMKEGKQDCGPGKGENGKFSLNISNLKSGKTYYVQTYAENKGGISYGNIKSFQTPIDKPTIETQNVNPDSILNGYAICGGIIISHGASDISECGICYSSTNQEPTIDNKKKIANHTTLFNVKVDSLTGGQTYYIRAYAKNQSGISYGNVVSFITPPIWETLAPFKGEKRSKAATFIIGSRLYITCGYGSESFSPLDDTYEYSILNAEWNVKAKFDTQRQGLVAFTLGNSAFAGIGRRFGGGYLSDFYYYASARNTWELRDSFPSEYNGNKIEARGFCANFALNNNGYIVGGSTVSKTQIAEVWQYHEPQYTRDPAWKKMNDFPIALNEAIGFVCDGKAYVGFGQFYEDNKLIDNYQIWEYNEQSDSWNYFTSSPGFRSYGVAIVRNKAYCVEARTNQGPRTMYELDLKTKTWKSKSEIKTKDSGGQQAIYAVGDSIYFGIDINSKEFFLYKPLWDN